MAVKRPQNASEGHKSEGHGRKSAAARESAIVALLTTRTFQEAATAAGVGERTIRRWLTTDSTFQADYADARAAVFDAAIGRMRTLSERAVATLESLLTSTT